MTTDTRTHKNITKDVPKDLSKDLLKENISAWWMDLQNDAGGRARLRRAQTTTEIAFEPAYHSLLAVLPIKNLRDNALLLQQAAVLAGVLATVKQDKPDQTFATSLAGSKKEGLPKEEDAIFSGLRFRRLIAARDTDTQLSLLRRAVHILDGTASVRDLAFSIMGWQNIDQDVQKRWALAYYGAFNSKK